MLNLLLLLGQDLFAEASSWEFAPGKSLQVSVAGDSQPRKTAAAVVAEPKEQGRGNPG